VHFGYNRKLPIVIRRVNNRTGILRIAEMQQLSGTVGKYCANIAKFTQEIQNGLRREITQIKHRTLCVPEMLELHIVSKNTTFWDVLVLTAEHHTTVSRNLPNILLHAHVLSRLSR